MRVYAYVRIDPNKQIDQAYFINFFKKHGYAIPNNRLLFEEVTVDTSIQYRDKIRNLVKHNLEIGDILIVKGLDCLGANFSEVKEMIHLIYQQGIILICSEFSKNEIKGDLKKIFFHFISMGCEFEQQVVSYKKELKKTNISNKVGRPELLNAKQKEIVLNKFKKGQSVYSLAKEFEVTRTVIQRILRQFSGAL